MSMVVGDKITKYIGDKITKVIADDQNTVNQGDLLFVILPEEK